MPVLVRLTIRVAPGWFFAAAAVRAGISKVVRRKGPRWFVASVSSKPSGDHCLVATEIPALLIRMSSEGTKSLIRPAASLTETWEAKLTITSWTTTFGFLSLTLRATAWMLESVREAKIKVPGSPPASARAVDSPIELGLTPVISTSPRTPPLVSWA